MNGERHWQSVHEQSRDEFGGWLDTLAHASGREFQHQEKDHHTEHPSIQGMWNPYVHTDPKVALAKFPSVRLLLLIAFCHDQITFMFQDNLSRNPFLPPSATEQLAEAHAKLRAEKGNETTAEKSSSRSKGEEEALESRKQSES